MVTFHYCNHYCHNRLVEGLRHKALHGVFVYSSDYPSGLNAHKAHHKRFPCRCVLDPPNIQSVILPLGHWLRFARRLKEGHKSKAIHERADKKYAEACMHYFGQTLYDGGEPIDFSVHPIGARAGPVPWPVPNPEAAPNPVLLENAERLWQVRLPGPWPCPWISSPAVPAAIASGASSSAFTPPLASGSSLSGLPASSSSSSMLLSPLQFSPTPSATSSSFVTAPSPSSSMLSPAPPTLCTSYARHLPYPLADQALYNYLLSSQPARISSCGSVTCLGPPGGLYPTDEVGVETPKKVVIMLSVIWCWPTSTDLETLPPSLFGDVSMPWDMVMDIMEQEERCPGFKWLDVHFDNENPELKEVVCKAHDFLHLVIDFYASKKWQVVAVFSPQDMKAVVTEGHKDQARLMRELQSCDLIYGGPYWNGDLYDDMGSGPWAMTGTQVRHLRVFLDRLSSSGITVWPKPSELLANGLKVHQYHVTWLAAESLGCSSPSLAVFRSRAELVQAVKQMEDPVQPAYMCIKRERSKLSNHAYFPENELKQPTLGRNVASLRKVFPEEDRTSRGTFAHELGIFPPRWFAQPFIPQIRYLGEVRVIIVNGIILSRVYTIPASLSDDGQSAEFSTQLGYNILDSSRVEFSYKAIQQPKWMAQPGDRPYQVTGEFDIWVLNMLFKLIRAEEYQSGLASSLRMFVRLDVSVYYDPQAKKHQWFVNEVTRSHDTGLWLGEYTECNRGQTYENILDEFGSALHYHTVHKTFCKPPPP